METNDLLIVMTLAIAGIIAVAYIVFVIGARSKEYTLSCPPCNLSYSSKTAVISTPMVYSKDGLNPPIIKGLPKLAKQPRLINASNLLFRNRSTGNYLSACDGCVSDGKLVVMAHEKNPAVSYTQWILTPLDKGYKFTTNYIPENSDVSFAVQISREDKLLALTDGEASVLNFTPADETGYIISNDTHVLKVCCSGVGADQPFNCDCTQFEQYAQFGVTFIENTGKFDSSMIWDIFNYSEDGGLVPVVTSD